MTAGQLARLADRLAQAVARTQERNRKARKSARKRRLRRLHNLGFKADMLPLCDLVAL